MAAVFGVDKVEGDVESEEQILRLSIIANLDADDLTGIRTYSILDMKILGKRL